MQSVIWKEYHQSGYRIKTIENQVKAANITRNGEVVNTTVYPFATTLANSVDPTKTNSRNIKVLKTQYKVFLYSNTVTDNAQVSITVFMAERKVGASWSPSGLMSGCFYPHTQFVGGGSTYAMHTYVPQKNATTPYRVLDEKVFFFE